MVVSIETAPSLTVGAPKLVFNGPYVAGFFRSYDIAPTGDRFLMMKTETDDGTAPDIILVQNWHQELLERVPVD